MKISLQLSLIPADTTKDKAKWAKDHGVEGLELGVWGGGVAKLKKDADDIAGVVQISSVCGNVDTTDAVVFDFVNADSVKRRKCIEGCKKVLEFCGSVGAAGQIVPPMFGAAQVPDLSPVMSPRELEDKLMVAALKELGPVATKNKTLFLLEPLNRYEQSYLRMQADGVRVIEASKARGVALLSDFFHMHIEELNTPAAFRAAGKHVAHIHLADNTRMEPGTGDIDFVAGFRALLDIGFKGYMAYECGITGENNADRAKNLAKSLDFVRAAIAKASKK